MPVCFGFLLVRLFPMYVVVLATEALRLANKYAGHQAFDWLLISDEGAMVEASNGIRVEPDMALRAAPDLSYAFVVAGDDQSQTLTQEMRSCLVRLSHAGSTIGAIDSGQFLLAESRLISDRRITIHPAAAAAFREQFPDIALLDQAVVIDGPMMTCAGGVSTVQLMLTLIERHCSAAVAMDVANDMVLSMPGAFSPSQASGVSGPRRIDKMELLLRTMRQNLEEPITLAKLSGRSGVSQRQIVRLFMHSIGVPPMTHYRKMRLNHAKQLLFQSNLSISEIAVASGFPSISAFSRRFSAEFGQSPRKLLATLRQAGNAAAVPSRNFRKHIKLNGRGTRDF